MRLRILAVLAVSALALSAALAAVGSASAQTPLRQFEGRVLSVDRDAKSFRLRDAQRGTVTVFVVRSTRFERIRFSTLRAGRTVEASVRRVDGRWRATKIQPNAGGHGGDDRGGRRGGRDDGPNHT